MRKIFVTAFITVDGVVEAPEKWSFPFWNDAIGKFKNDELFASDAMLLGRVTYEGFANAWPGMTDDTGYAERMNNLPKYVVSATLKSLEWKNSTLIKDNISAEVTQLKQQEGQNILVHCCPQLANTLMQHHLVDQFQLLVFPVVLGSGKRLFADGSNANLKLVETKTFDSGVVLLSYQSIEVAA